MSWFKFKSGRGDAQRSQQNELQDFRGQVAAFSRSQAMIEFTLDGKILTANEKFSGHARLYTG